MHPATRNILRYFNYKHLPKHLQETSKKFHDLAHELVEKDSTVRESGGAEVTVGLRKLLESKDCFVRASLK